MKKGQWIKVLLGCWAVYFLIAFGLDIGHRSIEFPGVRAVLSDALGTLAMALVTAGFVWLYYRAVRNRRAA